MTNFTGSASLVFGFLLDAAVEEERRGSTGAAGIAKLGAGPLFGFLLCGRQRPPEEEEPQFEESSDPSNLRQRASMMASFDMPLESSAGKFVVVAELSFAGIMTVRWKIRNVRRANL